MSHCQFGEDETRAKIDVYRIIPLRYIDFEYIRYPLSIAGVQHGYIWTLLMLLFDLFKKSCQVAIRCLQLSVKPASGRYMDLMSKSSLPAHHVGLVGTDLAAIGIGL